MDRKTAWILESKMEELDEDRLELLERRLADRVTERVRSDLFSWYAAIGTAVITVCGILGVNVVLSIRTEIKSEIKQEFEQELQVKGSIPLLQ
ncbi:MAG: hypothetical protein IM486_04965 [Microcystis sp. M114S2]|jgi:hypothetical protein|uniref:hypothetical protein n=1 Tax=unclassified Microcystis TaxID=2643300 RepID=UPI00258E1797|nr:MULTISPECIES: hypothetical protein [unclassified Microcystis]MCA2665500.1 hypothetical protein [Microcystis sp. M045S2]MCA2715519.1 hypothetical protein [Microcystis sp. M172S2]MCA2803456.1 hypothetical protein [Microcystis sp. M114S2]MCA2832956.1 hypothetical protein [Microcystis sp. M007S1]MCA2839301.1 hypothetical protein [Microcystis sp. M078S1]